MDIPGPMAYCGLRCDSCPVYLATRETDQEEQIRMRSKIAAFAGEYSDAKLEPEDITDCDGCRAPSGRLFSGCRKCDIRKCAQTKGCLTCAHCPDYPCATLQKFFATDPTAKSSLEEIRGSL